MSAQEISAQLFFWIIVLTAFWNIVNLVAHWAYGTEDKPLIKPTLPRTMLVVLVMEIPLFCFYLFATSN